MTVKMVAGLKLTLLLMLASISCMAMAQDGQLKGRGEFNEYELTDQQFSELMNNIQHAAHTKTYQGVFVTQWVNESMVTSKIINVASGGNLNRRVISMDTEPTEILRNNQQQIVLYPNSKTVLKSIARDSDFPGILLTSSGHLNDYYKAINFGLKLRVAAVPCDLIEIEPKQNDRYGFQLCVDPKTGLLLRVETLGDKHMVVSQTLFTDLFYDTKVNMADLIPTYDYSHWQLFKPTTVSYDIASDNWSFSYPPGFQVVASLKLLIGTNREVHQLTLSDGLASFSLFIQELSEKGRQTYGEQDQILGPINIYSQRYGTYWVTALGTMPLDTLKAVIMSAKKQ